MKLRVLFVVCGSGGITYLEALSPHTAQKSGRTEVESPESMLLQSPVQ